jgi:hypothetical protein
MKAPSLKIGVSYFKKDISGANFVKMIPLIMTKDIKLAINR